ncbi:neuronal cell adhesion molecule, partial [Exaiptasia diaphana]|uniref:Uncharacterized protein n=1 Tax=Exaiptasia diaphana TaxID=2652724 RepID=A0A913XRR1_EXADI
MYTCTARSALGVAMASSHLTVQVPPVFSTKPKSVIAEENFDVTLHCGASGLPRPTISWTRSIGDLPKTRAKVLSNNSLVIQDIKKEDGASYFCKAENLLGRVTTHAQITVLPSLKFTVRPSLQSTQFIGMKAVLHCQASDAFHLEWLKDNKPLGGSVIVHSNGTLVITKASTQNNGNYVCIARNFHRSIRTKTQLLVRNPKSCSEIKKKLPSKPSGNYVIDPDGQSGQSPFTVYCDMTDKGGVGVTVVSHDSEARTLVDGYAQSPGSYSKDVRYNGASMAQLAKLTQISTNCEQ